MLITRYNCFNTTTKYPDFMFAFHHSQCGQNEERMRQGARWGENPDWLSIVQLQKNYSTIFTCWPYLWYVDHISGMSSTPSIPGHRKNLYSLLCLVSTFNSFCDHALDEPNRQKEIWGDLRKVLTKSMKVEIYIYHPPQISKDPQDVMGNYICIATACLSGNWKAATEEMDRGEETII